MKELGNFKPIQLTFERLLQAKSDEVWSWGFPP
jgi:hypothetical protein